MTGTMQDDPGDLFGLDDLPGADNRLPDPDPIVALHAYLNQAEDSVIGLAGSRTSLKERAGRLSVEDPVAVAMVLAEAPAPASGTFSSDGDLGPFGGLDMEALATTVRVAAKGEGLFGPPPNSPFDVQLTAARNGDAIVYRPASGNFALRIGTVTGRADDPLKPEKIDPFKPREVGFWIELKPQPPTTSQAGPAASEQLMTVYTRRAIVDIEPAATDDEIKAFEQRLAMFTDPRGWDLSTGPDDEQDIGTMKAGWIQSYPAATIDGPCPDDAKARHVQSRLGTSWNLEPGQDFRPFYELVWPGFNRPWGVMLQVNYQVTHRDGSELDQRSGWDELLVTYRIGKHLHQRGGPLGRRPVGPSLMPVTRDDGHLRVTRRFSEGDTDKERPIGYAIEMIKELSFKNIVPGRVVDAVESSMPFVAAGWFGALHGRWFQAILDETVETADVEQREKSKQYYKPERLRVLR